MGRSNTLTYLPMDRYAKHMRIPPTNFNQLGGALAPPVEGCTGTRGIWDQDDRDTLAYTMAAAEEMIVTELMFYPKPAFTVAEEILFGTMGVDRAWPNREAGTTQKMVAAYGTEKLTLVQANATIQLIDDDSDPLGYNEVARIGGLLYEDLAACGAENEVAVFFRVADGAKDAAHPAWEIRPISVDIDGSTMRVEGPAAQFTKPNIWKLTKLNSADTDDWVGDAGDGAVVPAVDVYCRTVNTESPVTLMWDGICSCTGACAHRTQTACALPVSSRGGKFLTRPTTWNGATNVYASPLHARAPEKLQVSYLSGFPLGQDGSMSMLLERAIVKLTNAMLPEPPCGFCDLAKTVWERDRTKVEPVSVTAEAMPWSIYSQGALEAWKIVSRLMYGRGG